LVSGGAAIDGGEGFVGDGFSAGLGGADLDFDGGARREILGEGEGLRLSGIGFGTGSSVRPAALFHEVFEEFEDVFSAFKVFVADEALEELEADANELTARDEAKGGSCEFFKSEHDGFLFPGAWLIVGQGGQDGAGPIGVGVNFSRVEGGGLPEETGRHERLTEMDEAFPEVGADDEIQGIAGVGQFELLERAIGVAVEEFKGTETGVAEMRVAVQGDDGVEHGSGVIKESLLVILAAEHRVDFENTVGDAEGFGPGGLAGERLIEVGGCV